MGMVSLEVPVSSLVDSFNRKGKQEHDTICISESNISVDNSTILLDCENEIKGIVKKVVKFFNEFAERNIQSKSKRNQEKHQTTPRVRKNKKNLKEKLKKKDDYSEKNIIRVAPISPEMLWRNSIRLQIPEWRLQGGRQAVQFSDGTIETLTAPNHWYNTARYELRKCIPSDKVYAKRDYFKQLSDHILVNIFSRLNRRSLSALKMTCRDFEWIIFHFDILAHDSGWRKGKHYQEDRCKFCKSKRTRGDTSLCRYHPKNFIGDPCSYSRFYMCCRSQVKDSVGCRIRAEHDNYLNPDSELRDSNGVKLHKRSPITKD